MSIDKFLNVEVSDRLADKQRKKIGEILIEQGLVTEEELLKALDLQKKHRNIPLGQILVKLGIIAKEQIDQVLGDFVENQSRKKLGEILIEQGIINERQLHEALEEQRATGAKLGEILLKRGNISREILLNMVAAQLSIIRVNTQNIKIDTDLVHKLPEALYKKYKSLPLYEKQGRITVAMVDPTDLKAIEHLKFRFGKEIEPVMDSEENITSKIEELFRSNQGEVNSIIEEFGLNAADDDVEVVEEQNLDDLAEADEEGAQIIKLVNTIITNAIKEQASDIHIDPHDKGLAIRYRLDGILVQKYDLPIKLMAPIISRFKIISNIDISEKRKPQDGRSQIRLGKKVVDLRFATFPVSTRNFGAQEKIVIRILDRDDSLLSLDLIGFEENDLKNLRKILAKPNGIFLVTGPTGSGKSSTLYASLAEISTPEVHVVTLEDPVEYLMRGVCQGQVNPRAGFTFASGLRSILRLDPDIVMVGELRDKETVHIAIEAALTGHLVLSTLHTNDAPGAFTRLTDMGIETFLISSSVVGILAQRLARRLCPNCKEPFRPDDSVYEEYNMPKNAVIYRPKGCSKCSDLGYRGRTAIFELVIPDEELQQYIIQRKSSKEMKKYAMSAGIMVSLRQNGIKKVIQGLTSLEEVLRVTAED